MPFNSVGGDRCDCCSYPRHENAAATTFDGVCWTSKPNRMCVCVCVGVTGKEEKEEKNPKNNNDEPARRRLRGRPITFWEINVLRSEARRRIETNYVSYYYPLVWSTRRLQYRPYITRTSKSRVYNFYRDDGSRRIRRGSLRAGRFSSPVPAVQTSRHVPSRARTQRITNVYTRFGVAPSTSWTFPPSLLLE